MHKKTYAVYFIALIIDQQLDPSSNFSMQSLANTYKGKDAAAGSAPIIQMGRPYPLKHQLLLTSS